MHKRLRMPRGLEVCQEGGDSLIGEGSRRLLQMDPGVDVGERTPGKKPCESGAWQEWASREKAGGGCAPTESGGRTLRRGVKTLWRSEPRKGLWGRLETSPGRK